MPSNDSKAMHQRTFWLLWCLHSLACLALAIHVPWFVDEGFYRMEARHLDMAYADVPGMTAWLIYWGTGLSDALWAVRLPFVLLGCAIPWLVVRITQASGWAEHRYVAGVLAVLLPLHVPVGFLALPDAPMTVAVLLCAWGMIDLEKASRVNFKSLFLLSFGLLAGGFSHYRFGLFLAMGGLVFVSVPSLRNKLKNGWVLIALLVGLVPWVLLVLWNQSHQAGGFAFQFADRHPWSFSWQGLLFPVIQCVLLTPVLFVWWWKAAFTVVSPKSLWRSAVWFWLALWLAAFFVDRERLSMHWPHPAYLIGLAWVAAAWGGWSKQYRRWGMGVLALGCALMFVVLASTGSEKGRFKLDKSVAYPENFMSIQELSHWLEPHQQAHPNAMWVADQFKVMAWLDAQHPAWQVHSFTSEMNVRHGRGTQLAIWSRLLAPNDHALGRRDAFWVVDENAIKPSQLQARLDAVLAHHPQAVLLERRNFDGGLRVMRLYWLPAKQHQGRE